MGTDLEASAWVMERVALAMRIPQLLLEREAVRDKPWTRREVRSTVRALVDQGRLMYTYELGTSFLEGCYSGVSRLGERIVTIPPTHSYKPRQGEVPVVMSQGASFGSGRHPTTRLAVRAIEQVLSPEGEVEPRPGKWVLDVGTGTGILALAALKLGMDKALCTDIDPCALFETRENARLNGLSDSLTASDIPISEIRGDFFLVLANLRLPTLLKAMPVFMRIITKPGFLIVSGIQVHETDTLEQCAQEHGFSLQDLRTEQKWASMIFFSDQP
ncbi:MAG: 50S ribosomal protein L11 methyltransferase [Desulfatibacillum sp.]|nr:50S ribosomal protein L11 methyltransferase [Desulfatibacillum sp.]